MPNSTDNPAQITRRTLLGAASLFALGTAAVGKVPPYKKAASQTPLHKRRPPTIIRPVHWQKRGWESQPSL